MLGKKAKLLVIGVIPPPIGGVTVYVERLLKWLRNYGVANNYVDIRKDSLFKVFFYIVRSEIVHINISHPIAIFVLVIFSRLAAAKVIVTVHGNLPDYVKIKKFFMFMALRFSNKVLVLNKKSLETSVSLNQSTMLVSTYLPPDEDVMDPAGLSDIISQIIASNKIVVSTNAFDLSFDKNNKEIYGITDLIQWATFHDYFLVVSDASGNYFSWIEKNYPDLLNSNILFVSFPHRFIVLLEYVDYFIRNTTTDGDSVSVYEALAAGVTVYATNCVSRPDNVLVYDRLESVVLSGEISSNIIKPVNSIQEIIGIYDSM